MFKFDLQNYPILPESILIKNRNDVKYKLKIFKDIFFLQKLGIFQQIFISAKNINFCYGIQFHQMEYYILFSEEIM